MGKTIDCLLIGHNEMEFAQYEQAIRKMGVNSGAYRDLNLNFIRCNNKPYSISEIFNIYYYQDSVNTDPARHFHVSESFGAAIAYLGTYLDRRGYTFDYINSFQHSKAHLSGMLAKEDILTIAIITTLYVSVIPILEIIKFIRTYNRTAKIVIGGPFVSTRVRILAPPELEDLFVYTIGADFYVNSSQGEAALVKIIDALKNNLSPEGINNIYYKAGDTLKTSPVLKENNRLSENMVDWGLFGERVGEFVNVRTAISCPFSCSFCGFPQHAGKYQTAAVEDIAGELKMLNKINSLKSIHFIDDTFNIPVERFKNILSMMIKNQFKFKWHSYFRCQFADKEMVKLMKESGCEGVFLGLESGNDQILKNMNKSADSQKYLRGIQLLKEYGIVTFGNFIIGFPGETEETVQDTINFIEKSGLDFYRVQLWYCEPITPIWQKRDLYKINGESFEWSHATMNSQKACDLVEEIFCTIKNAIWIPQYNFDFDNLWHLVHRGMTLEQVKNFLTSFNLALREKISHPSRKETSYSILEQVQNACNINNTPGLSHHHKNTDTAIDDSEATFDFL